MEDDVEVSGGGRHQQEEEVEVGVGEEAVLVDRVEQRSFPRHRHLVRLPHILRIEFRGRDLLVDRLAKHHLLPKVAAWCHCIVEVAGAHHRCLLAWQKV